MPIYDEPTKWLTESIESILKQSYKHLELIVVLDKPDNKEAKKLIESYAKKDKRIVGLFNTKNLGRGASRNKAIAKAKGTYIAILDADDIALKDRLKEQVAFFSNNQVDLLFTWADFISEDGTKIRSFTPSKKKFDHIFKHIFSEHITLHPSMMVRAQVLKKLKYDETLLRSQDFDFWLRAIKKKYTFAILEKKLVHYRIPNKANLKSRVKRMKGYCRFSLQCFNKHYGYFWNNLSFHRRYVYCLAMLCALYIVPLPIIQWIDQRKNN